MDWKNAISYFSMLIGNYVIFRSGPRSLRRKKLHGRRRLFYHI